MELKTKFIDWIILATIASTTFYIVSRNLPVRTGVIISILYILTLMVIILSNINILIKKPVLVLLLYGSIIVGILPLILWNYMNEWNRIRISWEFMCWVVPFLIWVYYCSCNDFKKLAWLSKWAFIFITITIITTNIALFFDPILVRTAAATEEFTDIQSNIYRISGATGYYYAQALIFLIPILIYHIKRKQKMVFSPKILRVILLLLIILELRSQVFANILVVIVITIFSILGLNNRRVAFCILIFFIILYVAIPNTFYIKTLYSLSSYFEPGSVLNYKLSDFALFIQYPEFDISTGAGARAARYPMLFDALSANPIFGNASSNFGLDISLGAHIYWFNRLALWGIPGFMFFVLVLYKMYSFINSIFDADYRFYYSLSVAALIFLGLIKAIGGSEPWLMLILVIPGLYFLPLIEKHRR